MNIIKLKLSNKQKILIIVLLLVTSCFFTYYFYVVLKTEEIFTHFFYIPIILSSLWWNRKGLIVAIFLAIFLILSYVFLVNNIPLISTYIRAFFFIVIGAIFSELSYHISKIHKNITMAHNELNQIFNALGNGLKIIDKNFNIIRVNKTFAELSGLSVDEILHRKCYEVFPSNLCNTPNCCLKKMINDKKSFEIDTEKIFKDGNILFCILNVVPFYGPKGEFIGIIEDCKPITKRKILENKLRETSEYLEKLINCANAPIVVWNPELKITKFNHAFERLSCYTADEVIGKELCILFSDKSKKKSMDCIKLTQDGEYLESVEISILCKNKNEKIILWNSSNIYDKDNKTLLATIAQGQDITERKQTEKKILNAIIETEEKEKERFAKDLHDGLGTLLSSINIYISLIKSKDIDETEKQNMINYIKGLIDEAILNTKEIANNLRPNIINRFGLIPSIKSFCKKINNTGFIKILFNTNITKDIKKELEVTLFRIVKELINNALKHASAKNIEINLFNEGKLLIFTYKDNGIGFDTDKIINKKETTGMGIKNIISRIKAIDGTCKINSNKEKGTEIIIDVEL